MPQTESSIVIDVPPKVIYGVALDFESYPEFLPDVKSAVIEKKEGKDLLVRFEIQVIKKIAYSLRVRGTPHKRISWNLVEGDLFKKNDGGWTFEESGKEKTKATYAVTIDFGLFVPSLITSKLIGSNLPQMLKRFKERAEALRV